MFHALAAKKVIGNRSINLFELMWQHHSVKPTIHWGFIICPGSLIYILRIRDRQDSAPVFTDLLEERNVYDSKKIAYII